MEVEKLTGEENVSVINRITGKKVSQYFTLAESLVLIITGKNVDIAFQITLLVSL